MAKKETPDPRWFNPERDRFWQERYKITEHLPYIPGDDYCCVDGKWVPSRSAIAQSACRAWLASLTSSPEQ